MNPVPQPRDGHACAQRVRARCVRCAWSTTIVTLATIATLALVACAEAPSGRASSTAAVANVTRVAPGASPHGVAAARERETEIAVEVRAPLHARYDEGSRESTLPALGIVVTNRSTSPLDVSDLRVYLEAARNGVSFRCARVAGALPGKREPSVLAPGASFVFDRSLDCALPLVGAYAVHIGVSFGKGEWSRPRVVRSFDLAVAALPKLAPREIGPAPGLWATVGSSSTLLEDEGGGHGRTLFAITNATRGRVEPPRMLLALRVYKLGNPIPCEDEPIALALPAVLEPGQTHYEPVEVSCLGLSVTGSYDIAARLVVPGGNEDDREIPLGRLRVDVITRTSMVVAPTPRNARRADLPGSRADD
jgi:hypothetical protein